MVVLLKFGWKKAGRRLWFEWGAPRLIVGLLRSRPSRPGLLRRRAPALPRIVIVAIDG
jgi:hypothetical protein